MKKMSFAKKMAISLGGGLLAGLGFIFLREYLLKSGSQQVWQVIDNILFQDITKEAGKNAFGLFFMIGQLFINALQMVLVPLVFTSIVLAISQITDTQKLGKISYKTFLNFLLLSVISLIVAGGVGFLVYKMGLFDVKFASDVAVVEGVASSASPFAIIMDAIPGNITAAFANNGAILSVVVLGIIVGVCVNSLGEKIEVFKKLVLEINELTMTFLTFVITKIGPFAIFALLTRTFASYGIEYLKPAAVYVVVTVITLLAFIFIIFPLIIFINTGLNPVPYIKKMMKVAVFGFSTSSSAATLPLNTQTTIDELGVDPTIASFVVPLATAINKTGTAIMQVIAAIFIAGVAKYTVTMPDVLLIMFLAFVGSISTPAAPGAGATILFTILSGLGYSNPLAIAAYSLILAINRPVEMLVTSVNVIDDSVSALCVAKSEGMLDEKIYYSKITNKE